MSRAPWPAYGWIGLALVVVFWAINWSPAIPLRSSWGFFPLWLGYALCVDALVVRRKGSSLVSRSPAGYLGLFVVSAPAWWLFEILNWRTQNWLYQGRDLFTDWQYALLASLSFSTVMPAVFGTAELVSTLGFLRRFRSGRVGCPTLRLLWGLFAVGWLMLALVLAWPRYFFPFVWLSVYFILDPLNVWLGNRSLLTYTGRGDWRPVVSLSLGCLVCGLFWEMWNYYAFPKWVYRVPFVDVFHVFEMPLLGYGGYVPFAWELYALYNLVVGVSGGKGREDYLQFDPDRTATTSAGGSLRAASAAESDDS